MSRYEVLLSKETTKQSKYSPGIIQDSEKVARVLLSPKHYKNGIIVATAFQQIFSPGGFSILRHGEYFDESLEKTIELLESSENKYIGYASANVVDIRKVIIGSIYRVFIVLDTAREDRIAHADIFTTRTTINSEELAKQYVKNFIRYQISELFNNIHIKS